MFLNDKFKFGKHKGKTLGEMLSTEEGRDWLWWYVEQECTNLKFAEADRYQKKSIRRKLEQQMGKFNPTDVTSTMYLAGEIELIKKRLDIIEDGLGIHLPDRHIKSTKKEPLTKEPPTEEEIQKANNEVAEQVFDQTDWPMD